MRVVIDLFITIGVGVAIFCTWWGISSLREQLLRDAEDEDMQKHVHGEYEQDKYFH